MTHPGTPEQEQGAAHQITTKIGQIAELILATLPETEVPGATELAQQGIKNGFDLLAGLLIDINRIAAAVETFALNSSANIAAGPRPDDLPDYVVYPLNDITPEEIQTLQALRDGTAKVFLVGDQSYLDTTTPAPAPETLTTPELPDGDWSPWQGADHEHPYPAIVFSPKDIVDVQLRDGQFVTEIEADQLNWQHTGQYSDIVAYHVHPSEGLVNTETPWNEIVRNAQGAPVGNPPKGYFDAKFADGTVKHNLILNQVDWTPAGGVVAWRDAVEKR
jgi:hypothetical protein